MNLRESAIYPTHAKVLGQVLTGHLPGTEMEAWPQKTDIACVMVAAGRRGKKRKAALLYNVGASQFTLHKEETLTTVLKLSTLNFIYVLSIQTFAAILCSQKPKIKKSAIAFLTVSPSS